jgi:hypothetical protein
MLSFLHPGFLYATGAASAVVVALHFLVAEQPRAGILPTVRFFPDVEVRATALTIRLSDILLLLIRVLTLLLIGAAFAQPQLKPSRSAKLRILAMDVSRDVSRTTQVRDSAKKYLPDAATVIAFDSVATEMTPKAAPVYLDALEAGVHSQQQGSLSSALVVALRAASRLRERADSLELVVISPMLREETDSATLAIRALWQGRINIVQVGAARDTMPPLSAARLEWADSSASPRWTRRAHPDTVGALSFDDGVVVFPFVRKWKSTRADTSDRVIARWVDGEPAILEQRHVTGCVRSISIPIPIVGDAILRPSFARLFASLAKPCARSQSYGRISDETLKSLEGPSHLAATASIRPPTMRMTPLVPWLLGAALLFALVELLVRRRGERSRERRDEDAAAEATGEFPAVKTA